MLSLYRLSRINGQVSSRRQEEINNVTRVSHDRLSRLFSLAPIAKLSPIHVNQLVKSRRFSLKSFNRSYYTNNESRSNLVKHLNQFIVNNTEEELTTLDELLDRNGWSLKMDEKEITLERTHGQETIHVQVIPNSDDDDIEKAMIDNEGEVTSNEEQDAEVDQSDFLRSQHDYFKVHILKPNADTSQIGSLVFECSARGGALVVEEVSMVHPETPAEEVHTMPFSELSEELQASFEEFLQERGINTDMAHIVSLCLYKYDLSIDQKWAQHIVQFLNL